MLWRSRDYEKFMIAEGFSLSFYRFFLVGLVIKRYVVYVSTLSLRFVPQI